MAGHTKTWQMIMNEKHDANQSPKQSQKWNNTNAMTPMQWHQCNDTNAMIPVQWYHCYPTNAITVMPCGAN